MSTRSISPCEICGFPIIQNWVYLRRNCDSCWDWAYAQIAALKKRSGS